MLHLLLGNPRPWHAHYYCALALVPAFAFQLALFRFAHSERTSGASIAAMAIFSYLVKTHASVFVVMNVSFLFAWGVRVCARGVPVVNDSFVTPSACDVACSRTLWTWLLAAPTTFAVAFDAHELPETSVTAAAGGTLCALALLVDLVEKEGDGRFTRNPYAFSSIAMSWGLYLIHPSPWTIHFPVLFSYVVVTSPGGVRWNENTRRARAKTSPKMEEYLRATSPLVPLPPGVYAHASGTCRRLLCCDAHATTV